MSKRYFLSPILLLAFILIASFGVYTINVYITGHIRKNKKPLSTSVGGLSVFVKGDNKILAKARTNPKGNFNMDFIPKQESSFDFYCVVAGIDTVLISSVTSFESDTPDMTFYLPAIIKKDKTGKAICLKCKQTDKIYKIVYGDVTRHSHIEGEYYYVHSVIGGIATYYCDRDKVKF